MLTLLLSLALTLVTGVDIYKQWDVLMQEYVHTGGVMDGIEINTVDYKGIKADDRFWDFLEALEKFDTDQLTTVQDAYAFYNNVYNALVIKMIIVHACDNKNGGGCISGIRDIEDVWERTDIGIIQGRNVSLDDIETYTRNPVPYAENVCVHGCIVCGSISCPNVRKEAYNPQDVDAQMSDNFEEWVNNPKKGHMWDASTSTLTLSPIFTWFEEDFEKNTTQPNGVIPFILPYLDSDEQIGIKQAYTTNTLKLEYFDYDWSLNGEAPCECQ